MKFHLASVCFLFFEVKILFQEVYGKVAEKVNYENENEMIER